MFPVKFRAAKEEQKDRILQFYIFKYEYTTSQSAYDEHD